MTGEGFMGLFMVEEPDADVGAIAMVEPALFVPPRGNRGAEMGTLFAAGALTGFFAADVAEVAVEAEALGGGAEIGTPACVVVAGLAVVGAAEAGVVTTVAVAGAGAEIGAEVETDGAVPVAEATGTAPGGDGIGALRVIEDAVTGVDPDVAAADAA